MPMTDRNGDVSNPLATFAMMLLTAKVRRLPLMMPKMLIPSCKNLSPIIRHSGYTQADDMAKTNLAAILKEHRLGNLRSL